MVSWIQCLFWLIIANICFLVTYYLFSRWIRTRSLDGIWAKVSMVGVTHRTRVSFRIPTQSCIFAMPQLADNGYQDFNKALDQPFALPTPWVRSGAVLVLPPSLLPLLARPDKTSEGEWTNLPGMVESIQLPHVIKKPVYQKVPQFDVVRRKMARKDVGRLVPTMADEISSAFDDIWGTDAGWTTKDVFETCGQVLSRNLLYILTGLPVSCDEILVELFRQYANSLLTGGTFINCFPTAIRWLIAPLVALRPVYLQARIMDILAPVVQERIRKWDEDSDDGPDDFLQWMIHTCANEGPDQLDAGRMALRLINSLAPVIMAVSHAFTCCIVDIHNCTAREDILAGLEEECVRVSSQHHGLPTSESLDALYRLDSALRESMRVSDAVVTGLFRDVAAGEIDIGNGLRVGPGVRMAFPTQNVHLDPDHYDDPQLFDAFRFSRPFEGVAATGAGDRELVTTTTVSFLPFGFGTHACPGRWFAAQLMKQALAYMILNYEVELVEKPMERRSFLNMMVPPAKTQIRIRRRV